MLSRLTSGLKSPIRHPPQPLRRALPRSNPRNIMSPPLHESHRLIIIRILKANLIRTQLIMKSWFRQRPFYSSTLV